MKRTAIVANLVIGTDGSYSPSSELTSAEDRIKFHQLREDAGLVLVGGNTARTEPYEKSKQRVLIVTRLPLDAFENGLLENEFIEFLINDNESSIAEIVRNESEKLWRLFQDKKYLLIEAGPSIIASLVSAGLIDTLYLTKSPKTSTGSRLSPDQIGQLTQGAVLIDQYFIKEDGQLSETCFEQYEFWRGSEI